VQRIFQFRHVAKSGNSFTAVFYGRCNFEWKTAQHRAKEMESIQRLLPS
jgi:hypothetical protein